MNRRLVFILLLGTLVSVGYCVLLSFAHPFVVASPETLASIEVTEGQRAELLSARFTSEIYAYSVFGLLLCASVALVGSHPSNFRHRVLSVLVGCVLGALAGAVSGLIGHAFHDSLVAIVADPMVHLFLRLSAMLLPVAIAVGLSTSFACHSKVVIPNAVMGAVMGAELSALVYGVLAGVVTPLENVANIFPAHMENRYLLFVTAFLAIGIVDLIQAARTPSREHDKANAVVT